MKADAATERAVIGVLDDLGEALASGDAKRILGNFANDPDLVWLGSWEGERGVGPTGLERFVKQLVSGPVVYSFEWESRSASAEGSVAWVFAEGSVRAKGPEQDVSSPYRLTLVLVNRGGKWLILHSHGSEPAHPPG
jgi:uncharacterized protein (TIGR02246 family)